MSAPSPSPSPLLRHRLNPCDIDRYPALAPLGDALHGLYQAFTWGTDCTCCLGARVLALALAAGTFGVGITLLLTGA